ncbi:ATP-binding protein [Umezawaea sp.]|uniref:ATP-binding protein n=1 Tax=Umezawaea sp. TaxID=1955258 RepID=UPI002ED2C917
MDRNRGTSYRLDPPLNGTAVVGADTGPGGLLDARNEVVPFHGRIRELAALARWRDGRERMAALLLHGVAGVGKTRLVNKFVVESRAAGWTVLLARYGEVAADLRPATTATRLLVVVDDADRWPWADLRDLLREPRQRTSAESRVLLASRLTGWWWSSTRQRGADLGHVMTDLPLLDRPEEHAEQYALAGARFAATLGVERPPAALGHADSTFDVHLAALAHVLGAVPGSGRSDLVRHLMSRGGVPVGSPRLTEDFLAVTLLDHRIEAEVSATGLATLVQAARRWPHLRKRAEALFTADPELARSVSASTLLALVEMSSIPVLRAIAPHVFEEPRLTGDVLPAVLTRRLVEHAVAVGADRLEHAELYGMLAARAALACLRDEALVASHREVALYRELAAADQAEHRSALAEALGDLGLRYVAVHEPAEALIAAQESVALCEEVVAEDPDSTPQLAAAFEQLAQRCAALGLREDAVEAVGKATVLYQQLAEGGPGLFRLDFAKAGYQLAVRLFDVGRTSEAAQVADRAVAAWRLVAEADPRFEPDFARALAQMGTVLRSNDLRVEAVEVVEESIAVLRRLVAVNPRGFESDLAVALVSCGSLLLEAGRRDDAVRLAEEAVAVRRRIARSGLPGDRASLAGALCHLVATSGRFEDRLAAAEEAVHLLRDVDGHRVDLVVAWATLAGVLLYDRRDYEAHRAVDEVLLLVRRLPRQVLAADGPRITGAVVVLSDELTAVRHHGKVVELAEQVVVLWRELGDPAAHLFASHRLVGALSRARRGEEARGVAHAAVVLWHLYRAPDDLRTDMGYAEALSAYAGLCAETGVDLERALDAAHQAVVVARRADGSPGGLTRALGAVDLVLDAASASATGGADRELSDRPSTFRA